MGKWRFWRTAAPTGKPKHYRPARQALTYCGPPPVRWTYVTDLPLPEGRVPDNRLTTDVARVTCRACRKAIRKAVS